MTQRTIAPFLTLMLLTPPGSAQEAYRLQERFPIGYQYSVRSRVELSGTLSASGKDGKSKKLKLTGESSIDYDERILALRRTDEVEKTLRVFKRVNLERTVGGVKQTSTLRPEVYRIVQLRKENTEAPFSPDGPLTWAEIDLIRTDVFTPALVGLLPKEAVRRGDRWQASADSIRELTDMEKIEGGLTCRLEEITTLARRKHARVSFQGTVKGTNEDGPSRQHLEGFYYFDLTSHHLSYLSLRGRHSLLNEKGDEVGKVEGRFVLTRQVSETRNLSDEVVRRLDVSPNEENSLLLHESDAQGARFLYPRRWRVARSSGQQIMLDSPEGAGIVLTFDPLDKLPSANRFYQEARDWLNKQKATMSIVDRPGTIQRNPTEVTHFSLSAEMSKQKFIMDYFIIRDRRAGATLAARFPEGKGITAVRKEPRE